jgi:uncharacterized protein YoxC
MLWEISLLIIAIAFMLLVMFAIPSLLQFRRTVKSIELTSKTLNQNLPGILTNIDEITTNLTNASQTVSEQTAGLREVVDKIQDMTDDVVNFERQIRAEIEIPIIETVSTLTAIIRGTKAFIDVLRSKG